MQQNTSHAVMAQRHEPTGSTDDFPTPPWATRALIKHVLRDVCALYDKNCLEPACGRGHMAKTLKEYFKITHASDISNTYEYGAIIDYLSPGYVMKDVDWIITNPPFNLAEKFIAKALCDAKEGTAMLVRTVFIEGVGRYKRLFCGTPPSIVAPFTERVPMVKGRLDQKASSATSYSWLVWDKSKKNTKTSVVWIPPCRKELECPEDYLEI